MLKKIQTINVYLKYFFLSSVFVGIIMIVNHLLSLSSAVQREALCHLAQLDRAMDDFPVSPTYQLISLHISMYLFIHSNCTVKNVIILALHLIMFHHILR